MHVCMRVCAFVRVVTGRQSRASAHEHLQALDCDLVLLMIRHRICIHCRCRLFDRQRPRVSRTAHIVLVHDQRLLAACGDDCMQAPHFVLQRRHVRVLERLVARDKQLALGRKRRELERRDRLGER